ncbi:uncharacterized protein LOC126747815 [Anthonomus grandis grandis]|uniref:uncharacterized protein LOC126747815 n=1 Tax=Anthonomus grandis grandis TaxID=2921223 RepID=UPI002165C5BC|nr:uncharacterized protein LOC126747815 [Anthonomus grandis grandis]
MESRNRFYLPEEEQSFLKGLLSFLDEPLDYSDGFSSGYSSGSSEQLNVPVPDHFPFTSGHFSSFSCQDSGLSYGRASTSSRTFNMSWTESSTGLRVSTREQKSFEVSTHLPQLPVFQRKPPVSPMPTSIPVTHKEKQSFFRKNCGKLLMPELNNHPLKLGMMVREREGETAVQVPAKKPANQTRIYPKRPSFPLSPPKETKSKLVCRFCMKNGEPDFVYTSHFLKYPNGMINCPILKRYVCDLCGATGDYAHTRKYCPRYEEVTAQMEFKLSLWALANRHKL